MQVKKQQIELDMEQQTGSKLGKGYVKAVCMKKTWLDEAQDGIKIAMRNINNRYADDVNFMAESKDLKNLLKVKEESEKAGLNSTL